MLAIQTIDSSKTTPNLLPARIQHDGPINNAQQYWKPSTDDTGKRHAQFRGRHLYGTCLSIPTNYTGAVLDITAKQLAQSKPHQQALVADNEQEDDSTSESEIAQVNIAEQISEFDEIVVWGHGAEVDGDQDMFVRGLTEWIGFAESMHADEDEVDKDKDKEKQVT